MTSVARGTPMGELLRRYWHPVGLVGDAGDIPRKLRVLGEELVLFRDKHGRAGLLHARGCHRGTTQYYGKVEEDGIRCCYYGWKFDIKARCLEQRARGRPVQGQGAAALVSCAGALRPDRRPSRTGREEAGFAAP